MSVVHTKTAIDDPEPASTPQPACCAAAAMSRKSSPARLTSAAKARYDERALVLKALAHSTRLFIVDRLAEQEHCVCELTEMVGADISTVSKHLSVLANAGVVTADKRGSQVWYSLRVPCILEFFGCVEAVLRGRAR